MSSALVLKENRRIMKANIPMLNGVGKERGRKDWSLRENPQPTRFYLLVYSTPLRLFRPSH